MVQDQGLMKALLPILSAVLCGCGTLNRPALEAPPYLQVLERKGLDEATYARISRGRVLGYGDVMALVRAGVPGSMIVPYLRATRTPYDFPTPQINALVRAGADDELINYLGKARGIYLEDSGNVPTSTGGGAASHPYWSDPDFMDPAPFDFGYPDVWYNSDYWRNDNQGGHGGGGGGGRGGR